MRMCIKSYTLHKKKKKKKGDGGGLIKRKAWPCSRGGEFYVKVVDECAMAAWLENLAVNLLYAELYVVVVCFFF